MIAIRKLDLTGLRDDPWARWQDWRASYCVVVGRTDGSASAVRFPDLDNAERLVLWLVCPGGEGAGILDRYAAVWRGGQHG